MPDEQSQTFIDEVRAAVRASSLGVRQLAKAVGSSPPAISRFRNGEGVDLRTLDALAQLLALRVSQNKGEAARRERAALKAIKTKPKGSNDVR